MIVKVTVSLRTGFTRLSDLSNLSCLNCLECLSVTFGATSSMKPGEEVKSGKRSWTKAKTLLPRFLRKQERAELLECLRNQLTPHPSRACGTKLSLAASEQNWGA